MHRRGFLLAAVAVATSLAPIAAQAAAPVELLNVSYDPTRELYRDIDAAFAAQWKAKTGQIVTIKQSHGGSGAQSRLPLNSTPYYSTIVFLVRKGNPKGIHDWPDLIKPGVQVITPNPKTSGGARWNYLAAWGYAQKATGSVQGAREYLTKLFKNVPVLDSGARGATTTFVQRGQGDVLIAWENEAYLATNQLGKGKFEIVYPSISILAEPPVALVDKVVDHKNTRTVAEAYLKFLYTPEGQKIIAKNYYRPRDPAVAAEFKGQFPSLPLLSIDKNFGGWKRVQAAHFNDGGVFDQVFEDAKK